MTRFRKFGLAVAVAALALVLNGCGGSDDVVMEEPPPPTPAEIAMMELEEAQASLMGLAADASGADQLAAQQAVLAAAQKVVAELQAANAGTNEVTAAQAKVADYEAMVAATQQANAKAARQAALDMAKEHVMGLAADASHADMIAAHQAVVDAAQAVVDGLLADSAPHAEVVAAMAIVTAHEEAIADINMAMADAAAAASLMEKKDALMMAKEEAAAATSNAEMLAAQMAVVAAAEAVAAEAGASDADVTAANADVDSYTAMITQTERMKPLDLAGKAAQTAIQGVYASFSIDADNRDADSDPDTPAATIGDAADRAAAWSLQDPLDARFDLNDDVEVSAGDAQLFGIRVRNQQVSIIGTGTPPGARVGARAGRHISATAPSAFSESSTIDAPSVGTGWTDSVHERTYKTQGRTSLTTGDDVEVTDMVTTYTNQAPTQGRYYNELFPPPSSTNPTGAIASGPLQAVERGGVLVLRTTSTAQPSAVSDGFPSEASQSVAYDQTPAVPAPTTVDFDNRYIPNLVGTYRGVPGRFTCGPSGSATDCVATTDALGNLSLAGMWRFTPDGDPAMLIVPGTNTDADYLTFGYWLETTVDNSNAGRTSYEVGVFNMPNGNEPAAGLYVDANNDDTADTGGTAGADGETFVYAKRGSATYTGPAAGLFSIRVYDPESAGTVEESGRFTADAELTADFDQADLTIDGMITNFMHDGSEIDPQWSVVMDEGMITRSTASFVSNVAKQGRGDGSEWTGTFHGHISADDAQTPVDETKLLPTGVSGRFSDTFDNGAVLGAFGATR